MFESKYGKTLTIGLVILILIVIGALVFFTIDYIKSVNTNNEALNEANKFINEVNDPTKNNVIKNEEESNTQTNVELNIQVENIVSDGTSNSENTDTYKGFEKAGVIEIPKTNLKYVVLAQGSKDAIEVSVAVNGGPGLNKVGNTIIIGHNYRNGTFFSNNKNLANGDKVYITDKTGAKIEYTIYDIYTTSTGDSDYMVRDTKGQKEITLVTCTDDTKNRLVICAKAN